MKRNKPLLLLASASPRRKLLLRRLRWPFKVIPSRYEEKRAENLASLPKSPQALVMHHALQKTRSAVIPRTCPKNAIVIGADTIVVHRGKILEKPSDRADAKRMLSLLLSRTHRVITGLAILHPSTHQTIAITACATTHVRFKTLSAETIDRCLKTVNPLDKAGAYAIQEGPRIVKSIRGSRSNVIGLPLELLKAKLKMARQWFS